MKLVNMYFSATGSTQTIAREISKGTGLEEVTEIDLTLPQDRKEGMFVSKEDLFLISMPVYVGMIPFMHNLEEYLKKLTTDGARTVICVNYGTRHYEDAIKQIDEILTPQGFKTIAVAAFVSMHSFAYPGYKIYTQRPNEDDKRMARIFGQSVMAKVIKGDDSKPFIPGVYPPRRSAIKSVKQFGYPYPDLVDDDKCISCGECARLCPTGAIDETYHVNEDKCSLCMRCVRICPTAARDVADTLKEKYSENFYLYNDKLPTIIL